MQYIQKIRLNGVEVVLWLLLFTFGWWGFAYMNYQYGLNIIGGYRIGNSIRDSFFTIISILITIAVNIYILIPVFFTKSRIIFYFPMYIFICALVFPIDFAYYLISQENLPTCDCEYDKRSLWEIFKFYPLEQLRYSIMGSVLFLPFQYLKYKNIALLLEKEKAVADLNLLKSQMEPHFYFNTLNNLYGLALQKSDKLPVVILQLSKIMEYVLYSSKQKFLPLSNELMFIEDYIAIEKLRFDAHDLIKINKNLSIPTESVVISPLLLAPLIENAFKHGNKSKDLAFFLNVDISLDDKKILKFAISNRCLMEKGPQKAGGLGLENLKKRLQLLYPENHTLELSQYNNTFFASLTLHL